MVLGQRNIDEPPHVKEIRQCDETVEVNRLALYRLLLIAERVRMQNGSDRVAMDEAFNVLGDDPWSTSDIPLEI